MLACFVCDYFGFRAHEFLENQKKNLGHFFADQRLYKIKNVYVGTKNLKNIYIKMTPYYDIYIHDLVLRNRYSLCPI